MTIIPYIDLKLQHKTLKNQINLAVKKIFKRSEFILGSEVEKFEIEFSKYHNTKYGIGVNSGTSALHLALLAANVQKDDEVITVSMTFIATAAAILYVGAKPIFVDIDKKTLNIDPLKIEEKITKKTKAIIPVHLHGRPANMKKILEIAKNYNLIVIEDAAQAHGAAIKNKRIGSFGDIAAFSFYPGKNLGASGEAGIVITNNIKFRNRIKQLRDWGQKKKYHHDEVGFNYRMDGIQGAILRVKLKHLDSWIKKRRLIAKKYHNFFHDIGLNCTIEEKNYFHVYHVFSIFINNRDEFIKILKQKGIATSLHYPIPIHLQKPFLSISSKLKLPITEKIAKTQLSLPIYPELNSDQLRYILNTIKNIKTKFLLDETFN